MGKPKLLTIGGFLSFFAFGFVDNLKGPLLPELLEQNGYTYSQGALVLSAGYLGFILATLATGILSDIFSNRLSLLLAGLSLILGCSLIGFGNSFFAYFIGMGFLGIGLGAIELGGNGLMVELHPESKGRYLNLLGMCHGLGSLTVPLIAAGLLSKGVGWQLIYFGSSVTALPLLAIFGSDIWQKNESVVSESNLATKNTFNWASVRETSFTREMWLYYILLAAYVACELGVATWMVEFLQKNRGWEISSSSGLLSSFFVLLMLGRLLGAFVVDSVGYSRAICIALIGSVTCLFFGINGGGLLIFALPLSGLFMSIVFPTVAAAASDLCQANSGTVFGILFAFAGVGGALGPFTIGVVSDFVGIQLGLCTAIGFAAIALFALYGVSRRAGNQETT